MQNHIITLEQLMQSLELLNQIYDDVRIINPLGKRVLNFDRDQPEEMEFRCHDLWSKGKMCSNCISVRAYQQKETHFKLEHTQKKIYMVMAVPVQDGDSLLILELLKDITYSMVVDNFSADSNNPLLKLLDQVGQLHIRDSLTGIFNRRYIDERLPVDIHNSVMDSKPLSIILADIDRFKMVNDTHGHIAGDFVLKEFAQLLQSAIPKDGWVARYGGEEFLISLLNTGMNEAESVAEKIRSKVESSQFVYDSNVIQITSSFGVCTLGHAQELTMIELVEQADRNLYQAKNNGRNQVVASKIE